MTRPNPEARRENLHAIFKSTFADQPQGPGNCVGGSHPCRSSGRAFRTAAKAGSKTCFRGGCRGCKVEDVFFFGGRRRTNRTAIDSAKGTGDRAHHADEEFAIKARIARQTGSRTDLPIEIHCVNIIAVPTSRYGRFRTRFENRAASANVQQLSSRGLILIDESYACAPPPLRGM